ncbi:MAG: hypothetical protein IIX61_10460, partial [Loktanella sp.]|nr:hypothetical protein [Loktanella sp.]
RADHTQLLAEPGRKRGLLHIAFCFEFPGIYKTFYGMQIGESHVFYNLSVAVNSLTEQSIALRSGPKLCAIPSTSASIPSAS